jgi:hypothetical protein
VAFGGLGGLLQDPRTHGEPCLSVGEVGVNGPPSACLDWPAGACRLAEVGSGAAVGVTWWDLFG